MRNRARAGGDAGFSAVRGPREIADFVGWACARPPGPMKMQGTSGARHCYVFFTTTLVDFQSRDHQVQDAVRHLALGHLLELVARAIGEDDHAGVLVAAEADVLARDVIGDDCLQTLALHLLQPFAGEVGVLGGESDTEDAAASFSRPSVATRSCIDSSSRVKVGVSSRRIFPAAAFAGRKSATAAAIIRRSAPLISVRSSSSISSAVTTSLIRTPWWAGWLAVDTRVTCAPRSAAAAIANPILPLE